MSLPRYPKYKDSGVSSLGELPDHWKVVRLGDLTTRIGSGKTPLGGADTYTDSGVLFLRSQNVYDEGIALDDVAFIAPEVDDALRASRVRGGDILMNITGASIGRTCAVPKDLAPANTNQHVCVIRLSDPAQLSFVSLALKSPSTKGQIESAQTGAAREGLNYTQVARLKVPMPPPEDRTSIAAFLDRETSKIDSLIAEQQRLVELLKEKRQAVISHAVTKGLNPDAPMKASGVEWLGDVPANWKLVRLKDAIGRIEQGWSPQCESQPAGDDSWGVLKVGCVNGDRFDDTEQKGLPNELTPPVKYEVCPGDILVSRGNTRELVGMASFIGQIRGRLLLSDLLYRFKAEPTMADGRFLVLALRSAIGRYQLERDAIGTSASMKKVSQGVLREIIACLPPVAEQQVIASWTSEAGSEIDDLVTSARRAISLLTERRAALITAAVTGQIDVQKHETAVAQ